MPFIMAYNKVTPKQKKGNEKMSYEEALKAADELLKTFEKITDECNSRELTGIVSVNLETGEVIK